MSYDDSKAMGDLLCQYVEGLQWSGIPGDGSTIIIHRSISGTIPFYMIADSWN